MATLIYDGDCGICTASVAWLRQTLRQQPTILASQSIRPSDFGLTQLDVREKVWLCTSAGNLGGHEAVAGLFRMQHAWQWRLLGEILSTPPFSWTARLGYFLVARNRHRIPVGAQRCAVPDADSSAVRDPSNGSVSR